MSGDVSGQIWYKSMHEMLIQITTRTFYYNLYRWPKINEGVWIAYNFFIFFFLFFSVFCKEDLGNFKCSSTQLNNVPKLLSFIFQINDPLFWLIVVILMCGLDPQSQR